MTTVLLEGCFLFFVGSCLGWCIEVVFRRFFTAKKWINPGFLTGPYLPLYGFGLTFMYCVSFIPVNTGAVWADKLLLVIIAGALMTLLEYIAGIIFIKGMKIKLWDYSARRGNIQGIICPLFSAIWTAVAALYLLLIHPYITEWVAWFVNHLGFAFFVGLFFGVLLVDLCHSFNLSVKIRQFAKTNNIIISFEKLKESIKDGIERGKERAANSVKRGREKAQRASFIFAFRSGKNIQTLLAEYMDRRRSEFRGDAGEKSERGESVRIGDDGDDKSDCGDADKPGSSKTSD